MTMLSKAGRSLAGSRAWAASRGLPYGGPEQVYPYLTLVTVSG